MRDMTEALHKNSISLDTFPYQIIETKNPDSYEKKVVQTYQEDPEHWRKVIGDTLLFQFGVYDNTFSSQTFTPPSGSNRTSKLDESGIRYFEQQLFLAGVTGSDRPTMKRILDIGCGWGYALKYLAEQYPECQRLDGINVSGQQLSHCSKFHTEKGLQDRINLFQCNAKDIDLLPDIDDPYDLVVMRGVISHFSYDLFETVMEKLWKRMSTGGSVIISDNLYNIDLNAYKSDTPDEVDRLACKYRKTPEYFHTIMQKSGFFIQDKRVLPSNADAVKWLLEIQNNIEKHFPRGAGGALDELHVMCENMAVAIVKNKISIYSTVLKKP
ncbi:class I SAM-dependent methyltransferase [Halomonas binhaiensis]|uniref:Methyltransferase domain-containing protein n=1 Tax=Halomonas binhaiensis TaxID=2562282 RepID=A0A5C1NKC2_9GAMM|nr:class I SAM-dependent methyltransferase [Halomonas binhaiensis]QEM82259.1 methyltransferase domain-containing protein [Halomonas binhaiensis]